MIQEFKKKALRDQSQYGRRLTKKWRENMLIHIRSTCRDSAVHEEDINRWMKAHKWISVY